jgi:hypothetical protein
VAMSEELQEFSQRQLSLLLLCPLCLDLSMAFLISSVLR